MLALLALARVPDGARGDERPAWFLGSVDPDSIAEPAPHVYRMPLVPSVPRAASIEVWYAGVMHDPHCYSAAYVAGRLSGDHLAADAILPDVTKYPGECWMLRCMPESLEPDRYAAASRACEARRTRRGFDE